MTIYELAARYIINFNMTMNIFKDKSVNAYSADPMPLKHFTPTHSMITHRHLTVPYIAYLCGALQHYKDDDVELHVLGCRLTY